MGPSRFYQAEGGNSQRLIPQTLGGRCSSPATSLSLSSSEEHAVSTPLTVTGAGVL